MIAFLGIRSQLRAATAQSRTRPRIELARGVRNTLPPTAAFQPPRCYYAIDKKRRRNGDIKYHLVQLVDPETGKLHPPTELSAILDSIDRKTHFVELASEDPNPIVKIFDKKDVYNKLKAQKARSKLTAKKQTQKEVQITWGVAGGDLMHKLKKVREELEKGNRVDLVFASKKGQVLPSKGEMDARVQETVTLLQDVGNEWKPRSVEKSIRAIYFQGINRTATDT